MLLEGQFCFPIHSDLPEHFSTCHFTAVGHFDENCKHWAFLCQSAVCA